MSFISKLLINIQETYAWAFQFRVYNLMCTLLCIIKSLYKVSYSRSGIRFSVILVFFEVHIFIYLYQIIITNMLIKLFYSQYEFEPTIYSWTPSSYPLSCEAAFKWDLMSIRPTVDLQLDRYVLQIRADDKFCIDTTNQCQ